MWTRTDPVMQLYWHLQMFVVAKKHKNTTKKIEIIGSLKKYIVS